MFNKFLILVLATTLMVACSDETQPSEKNESATKSEDKKDPDTSSEEKHKEVIDDQPEDTGTEDTVVTTPPVDPPVEKDPFYKVDESIVRPDKVCGKEGYIYLHDAYIDYECGGCHYKDTFLAPNFFGADDMDLAWNEARKIAKEEFLETVHHNQFCAPECNLDFEDPLYKDFEYWLDNRNDCD